MRFAGSVSCFTSIAIDRARRSSPVVPAIDRKCFNCKQTTSHGLVCVCMQVNETGHAQRLNTLKQRPRKWFFREEVDFLSSLAFVVNKRLSIFQFPFASIRRATSEACSGRGKRIIDRSTSKRSSKKLQRATITAFFLDRSLVVVHCDRS